jgi:Zn-dependent M28 family amino/carboxypeptidase
VPQAVVAVEHYNRIVRMLQKQTPVQLEVDIAARYHTDDLNSFNVVAEIPGGDLKDEIVMLGGHFDSWHSGTGATDNAVGCGVALEAVRILQSLGIKPRRTVRIALWTGEEQGLLGSKAYVTDHFGRAITPPTSGRGGRGARGSGQTTTTRSVSEGSASATTQPAAEAADQNKAQPAPAAGPPQRPSKYELKPDHAKFAAYFNLDNGTGKVRGVYLQGNEAVRPIFRAWLAPFEDMGALTISPSNTGGTDHLSFDAVGLPGFQFIQDQLEYDTRTHHSSMDVYDRVQEDDMKQASIIMASFVYHAAMRDEKLPRKPLVGEVVSAGEQQQ